MKNKLIHINIIIKIKNSFDTFYSKLDRYEWKRNEPEGRARNTKLKHK